MRTGALLAVALLVVTAGCSGSQDPAGGSTSVETTAPGATATTAIAASDSTATGAPTPTRSAAPATGAAYPNPWGERVVTVGVHPGMDGTLADSGSLVADAVAWWNDGRVDRYGTYPAEFEYVGPSDDADIVVEFVDELHACGESWDDGEFLGCAPLLGPDAAADGPETVQVLDGYRRDDTRRTIKHELGHVLGVEHGEDPRYVMNATHVSYTLDRPNATERDNPWRSRELTVALTFDDRVEHPVTQEVRHALDYYEDGAGGWLNATPTFGLVEDAATADVRIHVSADDDACGGSSVGESCGSRYGYDEDGDGAIEYVSVANVTIAGIETERVAWHTGYWLGFAFGAANTSDLPRVFRDDGVERDGEWWKDDGS